LNPLVSPGSCASAAVSVTQVMLAAAATAAAARPRRDALWVSDFRPIGGAAVRADASHTTALQ